MAECPRCGNDASVWGRDLISGVCNECLKAEAREAKRKKAAEQAAATAEQAALIQAARDREAAETARLEQRVRDRVVKIK